MSHLLFPPSLLKDVFSSCSLPWDPSLHFPFPDAAYSHIECLLTVYTVSYLTFALSAASFCISGDSTGTLIEDCQLLSMLLPDSDKLEGHFPRKGSEISVSLTLLSSYKDCQW